VHFQLELIGGLPKGFGALTIVAMRVPATEAMVSHTVSTLVHPVAT
jgi:hypothetical protein